MENVQFSSDRKRLPPFEKKKSPSPILALKKRSNTLSSSETKWFRIIMAIIYTLCVSCVGIGLALFYSLIWDPRVTIIELVQSISDLSESDSNGGSGRTGAKRG